MKRFSIGLILALSISSFVSSAHAGLIDSSASATDPRPNTSGSLDFDLKGMTFDGVRQLGQGLLVGALVGSAIFSTCNVIYIAQGPGKRTGRLVCGITGAVLGGTTLAVSLSVLADGPKSDTTSVILMASVGAVTAGLGIWNLTLHRRSKVQILPSVVQDAEQRLAPALVAVGAF